MYTALLKALFKTVQSVGFIVITSFPEIRINLLFNLFSAVLL